jgi:4-alpha-glucanotransferase
VSRVSTIPRRASGVLLHPSSLPGSPGIGDFGPAAYRFVDWLNAAGQGYWQILPLVPVDTGGSPYNGLSALAGNPLLISPGALLEDGLVEPSDLDRGAPIPGARVDFPAVQRWKEEILILAHRAFRHGRAPELAGAFEQFRQEHDGWLPDYTLFRALRDHFHGAAWVEWPAEVRRRTPEALERWRELLSEEVERYSFQQFLFHRQWQALREYAAAKEVRIIGDLPIFVAHDSSDVWSNPHLFELGEDGMPTVVAGVPPDYFSATGQRWGNPLYRWTTLKAEGYAWWIERFRRTLELVDVVRVDHFRGFEAYWEIPASEETAVVGRWVLGPGRPFFHAVQARLGTLPVIAEDLGLITPDVDLLRDALGFPGMRVLQFAFDGDPKNPHLPRNHPPLSVAYTGTHDNDTVLGWWDSTGAEERRRVRAWIGVEHPTAWDFLHALHESPADLVIAPMQDLLGLGSEGRMNVPGRASANWTWRLDQPPPAKLADRLRALCEATGRTAAGDPRAEDGPGEMAGTNTRERS